MNSTIAKALGIHLRHIKHITTLKTLGSQPPDVWATSIIVHRNKVPSTGRDAVRVGAAVVPSCHSGNLCGAAFLRFCRCWKWSSTMATGLLTRQNT
jgi:hypothetical protein